MKKTLIKSEQEYREYVFMLLQVKKTDYDIWDVEGFDREKLNRSFKVLDAVQGDNVERPDDWSELLRYYLECHDNPEHQQRVDMRNSLQGVDMDILEKAFGLDLVHDCWDTDDDGNEIDEDGNIIPDDCSTPEALVFEDWVKELTYPLILVQWFDTSFDRYGDTSICAVEIVELKEFKL